MPEQEEKKAETPVADAVKVGERVYTSNDVQNMLTQLHGNTQTVQKVGNILAACERYGLDPEQFLAQAEGAWTVVGNLVQDGVIDRQGKLVKKTPSRDEFSGGGNVPTDDQNLTPDAKFLKETLGQVRATMEGFGSKMKEMEEVQTSMLRNSFHERIKSAHRELSDDDVSRVFALAMRDKTKTLFQHAQAAAIHKRGIMAELRKAHAEEFGVNLDEFDQNKLHMQDPKGAAVARFGGKKFSFKKGKDAVTPKEAMLEYFKQVKVGE
jgi:hypothetical protein